MKHQFTTWRIKVSKQKGIIKFFNTQKGFGFITPEGGGKEVFVHASNIKGDAKSVKEGTRVEYSEGHGKKGPEAIDVCLV